ncbi:MAG: 5-oxoprolinase subunit PxpB [Bacteroidetes bacterium]|nr:5-oxoprolinase subunit PxpB [Bacteroidota bacterium]
MKPSYQIISPTLGELVWHESPSDELLSMQLSYLTHIQSNYLSTLVEVRQGFTRLSLVWKNSSSQLEFIQLVETLNLVPESLPKKVWQVPVCYSSEYGQDLESFAAHKNLSPSEVIQLHTKPCYRIHFLGFLPGFFYLNGLSPTLHLPRKRVPSPYVPSGSVAIGGSQTGIYPSESPGGWHIIGKSPLTFFDSKKTPPVWAKPGEQIQFMSISSSQLENWQDEDSKNFLK